MIITPELRYHRNVMSFAEISPALGKRVETPTEAGVDSMVSCGLGVLLCGIAPVLAASLKCALPSSKCWLSVKT
jgi:hypothetical protein